MDFNENEVETMYEMWKDKRFKQFAENLEPFYVFLEQEYIKDPDYYPPMLYHYAILYFAQQYRLERQRYKYSEPCS